MSRERGKAELIVFIAYIAAVAVMGIFHEPWFDEAQAWSIGRSASFSDMIFKVPHYEGHPPLWYLLLAVPAKLGAPYEISLKLINLVICAAAVWLILYRSPFPKIIRCVIPFTFYFFYQTAVICRPYSLTLLALTLAAVGYKNRNEKPLRYILPLILLCASHAFGLLIAGGLCIVWSAEIFAEAFRSGKFSSVLRDKRCYALLLILAAAVFFIFLIIPAEDVYYNNMEEAVGQRILRNLNLLLIFPVDSLFGTYTEVDPFKQTPIGFYLSLAGGAAILLVLFAVTKKNKKLATFAVPYFMFLGFGIWKYLYWNHIGVSTFFIMFTVWIIADGDDTALPKVFYKIKSKVESRLTVIIAKAAAAMMFAMPLAWTVYCSASDIAEPYGLREAAQFIKDNGIAGHTVMAAWNYKYTKTPSYAETFASDYDVNEYYNKDTRINNTFLIGDGSTLSPYFDENIFYNFNVDCPSDTYVKYKTASDEENEHNFSEWRKYGYPEYMIRKCPIDAVFPELKFSDIDEMYEVIGEFSTNIFYKLSYELSYFQIYKLKDEYIGKGKPQ